MLHVHYNGIGVAGVYTYDVAETKIKTVEALAREHEFPLRLTMEPEEGLNRGSAAHRQRAAGQLPQALARRGGCATST